MKVNIKQPKTVKIESNGDGLFVYNGRLCAKTFDVCLPKTYDCYYVDTIESVMVPAGTQVQYLKSISVEVED